MRHNQSKEHSFIGRVRYCTESKRRLSINKYYSTYLGIMTHVLAPSCMCGIEVHRYTSCEYVEEVEGRFILLSAAWLLY